MKKTLFSVLILLAYMCSAQTIEEKSLKKTELEPTHINILDNPIEGVECKKDKIFSVQYQPEGAPGPQDSEYLFDKFFKLVEGGKKKNA